MFPYQQGDKTKAQFMKQCNDVKWGVIFPLVSNIVCFESNAFEPEIILQNKLFAFNIGLIKSLQLQFLGFGYNDLPPKCRG